MSGESSNGSGPQRASLAYHASNDYHDQMREDMCVVPKGDVRPRIPKTQNREWNKGKELESNASQNVTHDGLKTGTYALSEYRAPLQLILKHYEKRILAARDEIRNSTPAGSRHHERLSHISGYGWRVPDNCGAHEWVRRQFEQMLVEDEFHRQTH